MVSAAHCKGERRPPKFVAIRRFIGCRVQRSALKIGLLSHVAVKGKVRSPYAVNFLGLFSSLSFLSACLCSCRAVLPVPSTTESSIQSIVQIGTEYRVIIRHTVANVGNDDLGAQFLEHSRPSTDRSESGSLLPIATLTPYGSTHGWKLPPPMLLVHKPGWAK